MIKMVKHRCLFLIFLFACVTGISFSQSKDSTKVVSHFGGSFTLTNKGVSSIPNLTLGKPAAIIFLSMGRKLAFEPEFRIAMEGKPWMLIFWGRYDLLNNDKFFIRSRINTSLVFKTIPVVNDGVTVMTMAASRTFTADLSTNYFLSKNISIGPYYMYVYGIEKNAIKHTHFLALRATFSSIKLSDQLYMRFVPQIYYLRIGKDDGFYSNATLTLAKRNFPFSVSTLISKTINTNIPIGENFLWNLNLIYTFNKNYTEKR